MNGTKMIAGTTAVMLKVLADMKRVAPLNVSVVINGESGTGKELLAQAIHAESGRKGQLVAINCSAIPEELLESELFGHEKGAFTGAVAQRRGLLEQADNGTVFIDEVGDIPTAVQVKLLRFLQGHIITRVGGTKPISLQVRVVAATHRNLEQLVAEGKFREDLYYRLNVIPLRLPPLRERRQDVPLLVEHFIQELNREHRLSVTGISPAATARLLGYSWPGNIRQLANVIERATVLKGAGELSENDLPDEITTDTSESALPGANNASMECAMALPADDLTLAAAIEVAERAAVRRALTATNRNITAAAKLLGVDRGTLHNKVRDYGF